MKVITDLLTTKAMQDCPLLLVVDGSSYLYRAFHAMPNLRNQAGEPTGAIYGITNMLKRLVLDFPHSTHRVCVFDAPGKNFRDDLYPQYKANRSAMPDDLRLQVATISALVAALGWHVLTVPGVEADDVIGTLAVQATTYGANTIISTGDKDMAQLVNDHVFLVDTLKQERLDSAGVAHKFGVLPEQIVDYLALVGDTVDNVPGVKQCGEKTAVKWLTTYGNLDNLIAHAAEIKGVVGEHLRQFIPQFALTKPLLTICSTVDLSAYYAGFEALKAPVPDVALLQNLFHQLGFRTWLRELTGDQLSIPSGDARASVSVSVSVQKPNAVPAQYEVVDSKAALQAWLVKLQAASLVALDTETTALGAWQARLVGISLCCDAGVACYIPVGHTYAGAPSQLPLNDVLDALRPWLESTAPKVLQHAKFDMHVLANHGIMLRGVAHDTLLAAYVLESHQRNNLGALAQRWLGQTGISYEALCGKGAKALTMDQVDIDRAARYAAEDADFTWQLHHLMQQSLQASPELLRVYALEIASQPILFAIERTGVHIDSTLLKAHSNELGQSLLTLEQHAHTLAGQPFNLNSPKQVGDILYETLKYPIQHKTASGAPSTDEDTLQTLVALDCPMAGVLLEYRGLAKLKNTYTDTLPTLIEPLTGRVHTHYAQAAVITGRLSSSDPNLQNIPIKTPQGRRVRQAFIAPLGHCLVSADYSQIELRIMAHLSQDAALIQALIQGNDVHRATAAEVFEVPLTKVTDEQRRYAKAINFGLIYGMGAFGLAQTLGISNTQAKQYIERYFARYTGVKQFMEQTKLAAKATGYAATLLGRRIWLPEINGQGPRRASAERAAINAPMQGTAADFIKQAMVDIAAWLIQHQLKSRMVMQVHDELVLEVPMDELALIQQEIPRLMAGVAQLSVPLLAQVGVGNNWDDAH